MSFDTFFHSSRLGNQMEFAYIKFKIAILEIKSMKRMPDTLHSQRFQNMADIKHIYLKNAVRFFYSPNLLTHYLAILQQGWPNLWPFELNMIIFMILKTRKQKALWKKRQSQCSWREKRNRQEVLCFR